jgi:hypothetical protein
MARGGGLAMLAVRIGTFSRYSHAAICERITDGGSVIVIEAMPSGCRRRVANPGEFVWSDIPLTTEQRADIVAYAQSCLGVGYDWPAIGGFIVRWWSYRLMPWRRHKHTNRMAARRVGADPYDEPGGDKLMCAELVVRAYRRVLIDMAPGRPADAVNVGDLRQWLDDRRRALHRRR